MHTLKEIVDWTSTQLPLLLLQSSATTLATEITNWLGDTNYLDSGWELIESRSITYSDLNASMESDELTSAVTAVLFGNSSAIDVVNAAPRITSKGYDGQNAISIKNNLSQIRVWINSHIEWPEWFSLMKNTVQYANLNLRLIGTVREFDSEEKAQQILDSIPNMFIGQYPIDMWYRHPSPGSRNITEWGNMVDQALLSLTSDSIGDLIARANVVTRTITQLLTVRQLYKITSEEYEGVSTYYIELKDFSELNEMERAYMVYAASKIRQNLYACRVLTKWGAQRQVSSGLTPYQPPIRDELSRGWAYGLHSPGGWLTAEFYVYGQRANLCYGDGYMISQWLVTPDPTASRSQLWKIKGESVDRHVAWPLVQQAIPNYRLLRVSGLPINELHLLPAPFTSNQMSFSGYNAIITSGGAQIGIENGIVGERVITSVLGWELPKDPLTLYASIFVNPDTAYSFEVV
jgi:hypothetical protein